jgi:hypothetical protein
MPPPPLQPQAQAPMAPGGAPGGMQMAQVAPQQPQPQAQPRSGVDPRVAQIMMSPYLSSQEKQMLIQQVTPEKSTIDLGDAIGVMDKRTGQLVARIPKVKAADYGEVYRDGYGNPVHGFRDYNSQQVKPTTPQGGQQQPVDARGNPIPPNIDPKIVREADSKSYASSATPMSFDDAAKLRTELKNSDVVKKAQESVPIFNSMVASAKSGERASDIDFLYGIAKVFDPDSVVRDSENRLVIKNSSNLPDQLVAMINSAATGAPALTPEMRRGLLSVSYTRVQQYEKALGDTLGHYKGIVERNRGRAEDVIPPVAKIDHEGFTAFRDAKKPATATEQSAKPPQAGDVMDGWRFKGGDPSKRENWQKQ